MGKISLEIIGKLLQPLTWHTSLTLCYRYEVTEFCRIGPASSTLYIANLWQIATRPFFGGKTSGLHRFLLVQYCTKTGKHVPNVQKITKWPLNIPNGHRIYNKFRFQGTPKYTQSGIFGMKICHLATLENIRKISEGQQ
jgi:hypothetical protein